MEWEVVLGLWEVVLGLWEAVLGLCEVVVGLWGVVLGLWEVVLGLRTAKCKLKYEGTNRGSQTRPLVKYSPLQYEHGGLKIRYS
jgi:hypothetical protein